MGPASAQYHSDLCSDLQAHGPCDPWSWWGSWDADQQCVGWGLYYFAACEWSFTKDVIHQASLIVISCISPPGTLTHSRARGECFKVVEITQQIYTNISGLGVGCSVINWTYSWIQIVSVIIAPTCNIYLEALFLLGLMINLGGKLTMCSWSYKAAGLDDYKSKLQVLEEFTRSEGKF